MTDREYRAAIIETVLDQAFDKLEAQPAVRATWTSFLTLAQPFRDADEKAGRALVDAANGYAATLAQNAFLAGLAFDGRALMQQAAAEFVSNKEDPADE